MTARAGAPAGADADGAPRRGRGRPRRAPDGAGGPATRERILASAREAFSASGYDKASVRAIARGAGVDPALVHHYFGTKEGVFSAAVAQAAGPAAEALASVRHYGPDEFSERFTRVFVGVWEDPALRAPLLALIRSALTNETATRIVRDFVATHLVPQVAGKATGSGGDERLRAELAASQLVGAMLLRYLLRVEPLASASAEQLITRLAPAVRHHLTGGSRDGVTGGRGA
ncbi:TetR family transcriptional regulator [Streptomyces sp. 7-21]|uniref:TetR/AcrR family transcriptional regulator n=1 Tax=Streptomyces sp. 7-21 TaxID=2802283 RepID=UPI00191FCD39|nr:TetR family transcriptional regulator [Streptomyces sp. 7-21]MBL1068627.1 TetR family transcriptional regulator [Streptomyces sp. 7-21]